MDPYSTITLLIVDDESEIRSGLRTIIPWEHHSIKVIGTAAGGIEALNKIRFYEPDIVICDIQMPGMNGLELIRQAKKEQFHCSFVILSGYDDFEYAKTAIKLGVHDYLLKPISIKELTELVLKLKEHIITQRNDHTDQVSTLMELRTARISLRKHNLIPELLRSELSLNELYEIIGKYALPIKEQESCAVLIQAFSTPQDTEEQTELSKTIISLKTYLEQKLINSPVLISEHSPSGLLLICNTPLSADGKNTWKNLLNDYTQTAGSAEATRIFVAIGKSVSSLLDIPLSYQSVRQIITWHIYPDTDHVITASVLDTPQPPVIMPGSGIMEAILKDNRRDIKEQFCLYLDQLLSDPAPPPSYLYSMCNYLIIMVQNQLTGYLGDPPKSFSGNSYVTLQNMASLEDIKAWMCEILCEFSAELSISRATKSDPVIEKAIAYINQNLLKNPRTEDVCNFLGMSKSYFSTYFKNKTRLNFRDYILNLKINYAQEQLKHPERTPSEVAYLLKYEDYGSFSRAFKTRTGLTPSDYQKQYTSKERKAPLL